MRLIDADSLKEKLFIEGDNWNPVVTEKEIDEAPTVYDVDKIVEQLLEEESYSCSPQFSKAFERAIEIVKAGGIDD